MQTGEAPAHSFGSRDAREVERVSVTTQIGILTGLYEKSRLICTIDNGRERTSERELCQDERHFI